MNTARQRSQNRIEACLFLCMLITVYTISRHRVAQLHRQQTLAYGGYTLNQIVKRSEVVCRTLAPRADRIEFTAEKLMTPEGTHGLRREWSVDCRDRADNDLANMTWNAETGQLVLMSGTEHWQQPLTPTTPAAQVTNLFRTWLCELGMTAAGERWDVMDRPRLADTTWRLDWRRGDEVINVKLCLRLGQLTLARRHLRASAPLFPLEHTDRED